MSTVVLLGNPSPQMQHRDDEGNTFSLPADHLNQSVTRVVMWDGFDDQGLADLALSTDNDRFLTLIGRGLPDEQKRFAIGVSELEQVVGVHMGGGSPDWISCSDPDFQTVLCSHFNCPAGEPVALLTNNGRDALHKQHMDTSAQPASFNYIALTASTTTPSTADTTLTGEIATGGGGLVRAQATFAHTTGTNTSTLTKTFTANGSDSLPVTVAQIGVFNASSVGTLGYHTALATTATISASGDSLTITETITAG